VRNEEALQRVEEDRNIPQAIKMGKANWILHILHRNCILTHIFDGNIEGRIEVTGRRGRRSKQLLDDLEERRGYWKLKREVLARTVC